MFTTIINNKKVIRDENHTINIYHKYLPIKEVEYRGDKKHLLMLLTPKCANSTIANLFYNENCGKTVIDNVYAPWKWKQYFVHDKYVDIHDYDNRLSVAVLRDPLNRLVSAFKTFNDYISRCRKTYTIEQFAETVINSYECEDERYHMDRHITSQFKFHNYDDIDLYVNIEDLNDFFAEVGIETQAVNVSKNKVEFPEEYRNKIIELLAKDYEIYNKIQNSEKIYHKL